MFRSGHSRPIAPRFKPEYQEQHLFATDIVSMSFDDNEHAPLQPPVEVIIDITVQ